MSPDTAATRPEDDLGLAGRVAIVTGGGAAGDGIGNGRAACILLARSGTTVLVATHDRALIQWVGRRVIQLDHGRAAGTGEPLL